MCGEMRKYHVRAFLGYRAFAEFPPHELARERIVYGGPSASIAATITQPVRLGPLYVWRLRQGHVESGTDFIRHR